MLYFWNITFWVWACVIFYCISNIKSKVMIKKFISLSSCMELQTMQNNLNGEYQLSNSIDCSETLGWNNRAGFVPIGNFNDRFRGTLDGQGFTISNIIINRTTTDYVGLFGFMESTADIRSLDLVDCLVLGRSVVGGLVGANYGTITDIHVSGKVLGSGSSVGGLAGENYYGGTISKVDGTGYVSGLSYVGGLVGFNNLGNISESNAMVYLSGSDSSQVGGLVGRNSGTINNAYATGHVSGANNLGGLVGFNSGVINKTYSTGTVSSSSSSSSSGYIGGLVGYNIGSINNSYATGSTSISSPTASGSSLCAGGLVAYNNNGTISNSYATGSNVISTNSYGSSVGGLIAYNYFGSVSNVYATGSTTSSGNAADIGGLIGYSYYGNISNAYAIGRVSAQSFDSYLGGLIGVNQASTVQNSYWDTQTSGQSSSAGGSGKTTAEMYRQETFVGWNFLTVWMVNNGTDYPKLQVFDLVFNKNN